MSDQHNARCAGFAGHPNVRTPNLDRIAERGVNFSHAFCNNPICSPSRICFITGQYMRTHGMFGNDHAEYPVPEPDTIACQFRRYGYQTGLFGKSHMVRRWDEDGFETIRYTDLCDALHDDPTTTHYFRYLDERGLADWYEEGNPKRGQEYTLDGSAPALLPYEHSIERYTGNETLKFLEGRDTSRPFFIQMSFQRPHAPIAPAREHFDLYRPDKILLPESAFDYFENRFAGKPEWMRRMLENGCGYPLADPDPDRLKRCLASYFALITAIDGEIGHVLDHLEAAGEWENTVIVYAADHGDFAGEHGLFHKNFGIYESIHRIPFLLSWPGGPQGLRCDELVESIDLYPTLCDLCDVPLPPGRDGVSLLPVAAGESSGREAVFCEWDWMRPPGKISAIRTRDFRLVFYEGDAEGELYDHRTDPGETRNLWDNPAYLQERVRLTDRLLRFTLGYAAKTDMARDRRLGQLKRYSPTDLLHKHRRYWSRLQESYTEPTTWPSPASQPE
jgi:arylsulfatase A-like enzyme